MSARFPQTLTLVVIFLSGIIFFAQSVDADMTKSKRVDPIFFANFPDDNHCLQASLMIVLNALGHQVRWDEINKATDYEDKLYSWTINGAAVLASYIKGVKLYAALDYARFATEGEQFLAKIWRPEYHAVQKRFASPNFTKEQRAAKAFVANNTFQVRQLTEAELTGLLRDNLVVLQVRANLLFPENGTGVHYVVLYAEDGDAVWLHDPGLPPRRSAKIPKSRVHAAYTGELIAIPHGGRKFGPQ